VVILLAGLVGVLLRGGGDVANEQPTVTTLTEAASIESVAESFMSAWVEGDASAAAAMFTADGTYNESHPRVIAALQDWYRAVGMETRQVSCGLLAPVPEDPRYQVADVSCRYAYENDLTKTLETGPVAGVLELGIDDRGIEWVFDYRSFEASFDTWYRFSEWVSSNHPDDFERMYISPAFLKPHLDSNSIALWEQHVDEFVADPNAASVAEGELTRLAYGARVIEICANASVRFTGAMPEFGAPNPYFDENEAAHQAAAEISEEALAELRAIQPPSEMQDAVAGIFSLMEEEIAVDRQLASAASVGDTALVEELTRQRVDLTHQKDGLGGYFFWYCPVNLGA
jgi:hypothetical protein